MQILRTADSCRLPTADSIAMLKTQELQINIGPQHPSTHGVFRLIVTVDGETIIGLKPVFGYLHRNHEQLGEVNDLYPVYAVHRPARLLQLDGEQLRPMRWRSRSWLGSRCRSAPTTSA